MAETAHLNAIRRDARGLPSFGWPGALLAGAASGVLLGAAFPSLGWDWLAWIALVPLILAVARARSSWQALWAGYCAGAAFFAVSCPWIAATVHNYGGLSDGMAGLVFVLFLILMGGYFALFGWAGAWLGRRLDRRLLPLPFLWVAVEFLRTYTPMGGFPWNLLGYSQYQHAGFMLVAPLGGVYAASFLIVLANVCIAGLLLLWHGVNQRNVLIAEAVGLGLILALATLPYHPPGNGPRTLRARLVQPNAQLRTDWTGAAFDRYLREQLRLSLDGSAAPVQLIIWPEQPAPLDYAAEPSLQRLTAELVAATHAAFLFGEVSYGTLANGARDWNQPRNSAQLILSSGVTDGRYDKMHLVPFGEYVPLPGWFKRLAGVSKLIQGVGDFVPGDTITLLSQDGHRFATMICYESIFPEIARRETLAGAEFLVNQSDDSWYGHSSAAAQGLMMAQVRAMENRRWLLRDTDNGFTAVVDPYGRITASLPRFQAQALEAGFSPQRSLTFYTRRGDWLPWACVVIIGLLALGAGLRSRYPAFRHAT